MVLSICNISYYILVPTPQVQNCLDILLHSASLPHGFPNTHLILSSLSQAAGALHRRPSSQCESNFSLHYCWPVLPCRVQQGETVARRNATML